MSETTPEPMKRSLNAYQEAPEVEATRLARTGGTPSDWKAIARDELAQRVAVEGLVIDFTTLAEASREAVVVNDEGTGYRTAGPSEAPTGHIVLWVCEVHPRVATDSTDPLLPVVRDGEHWLAAVPADLIATGGSCRIAHNLDGEVTVHAVDTSFRGIGYLFATALTDDVIHVEFFGGTAHFTVTRDDD